MHTLLLTRSLRSRSHVGAGAPVPAAVVRVLRVHTQPWAGQRRPPRGGGLQRGEPVWQGDHARPAEVPVHVQLEMTHVVQTLQSSLLQVSPPMNGINRNMLGGL